MKTDYIDVNGYKLKVYTVNTAVVGSGAAGFNAADCLYSDGCKDIVLITEGINRGTSRNTGSDKQTYYKLTLAGGEPDSVMEMAKSLFEGHCVDGDHALAEAANSVQGFLKLCELGIPFPTDRFGQYVGYKTDHDPRTRASSAGPYTSKYMTEVLEKAVKAKHIEILDDSLVVQALAENGEVKGLLCLNSAAKSREDAYFAVCCTNVIWATGGPAGMYEACAFPLGHYGMSGVAYEAGVRGKNLTEWQFGMASIHPRWCGVSGAFSLVMPRYYSTLQDGVSDEREFLSDFFDDRYEMLSKEHLKGYQWPFDVAKVDGGSSIIDILVYIETVIKGRRVFLDYTKNAGDEEIDFSKLEEPVRVYLENCGCCIGKPIDRLRQMNAPAIDFWRDKGIDVTKEPVEIAVCAQHNNGGLDVDAWWQTCVKGFFAAGEAAGAHGVCRSGGAALNSTQVSSMRAAKYISAKRTQDPDDQSFERLCRNAAVCHLGHFDSIVCGSSNVKELWHEAQHMMTTVGGPVRDTEAIPGCIEKTKERLAAFDSVKVRTVKELADAYHYRDALITQIVYLGAMLDYDANGGKSRGSAVYRNKNGRKPYDKLPDVFTYIADDGAKDGVVQIASYSGGECTYSWRPVRPIPEEDSFFENVWREYRKDGNVR